MNIYKITFKLSILFSIIYTIFVSSSFASNVYVGVGGGYSKSLQHKVRDRDTKSVITIERSKLYNLRLGYRYYPGFSIELSGERKPKYDLDLDFSPQYGLERLTGKTKIRTNLLMVNLLYDFIPIVKNVTPYFIFGAGVAQMSVHPSKITKEIYANNTVYEIEHTKSMRPACQIGLGTSIGLIKDYLKLDLSAKIQVVSNIKARYNIYNPLVQQKIYSGNISKTIGVAELNLGIVLGLPI